MAPPGARQIAGSLGVAVHRLGRLAARGPALRILYYHSVSDDPIRSSVSPAAFERQMGYLARGGHTLLSLGDAIRRLRGGAPLPARSLAVTLDDGFRDNYERAFPILARHRIPATIFLTATYIGTDRLPTLSRTDFVPRPLDWAQVREMLAAGIEFGSHTLSHPMLSQIALDEARREIEESKRRIEGELGAPAALFCYPRGDFSEPVKALVREAGYEAACATLAGLNRRGGDLFALRRTYVGRHDSDTVFAHKVRGGYDLLQTGLHRWRRWRAGT